MEKFKFIDLFCGIGGFHQAMRALGGECVYASDIDPDCRHVYELNYQMCPSGDITKTDERDIRSHEVLCAGFPCQSFSIAGKMKGFSDSTRGTLFFDILRILKYHRPKYALLENVRNLATHDKGHTWEIIHASLSELGYNVIDEPIVFSPHWIGIPQNRERVFIMCVREDVGELPRFSFDKSKIPDCTIDTILLDDKEIDNIDLYRLSDEQIRWIDLWNDFIKKIDFDRNPPSFPIWADSLCDLKNNPKINNEAKRSQWVMAMIKRNSELWNRNKSLCEDWLIRAKASPLFYGAKSKFEWKGNPQENLSLWDCVLQIRPSGLRAKPSTYFPTLVTIKTQVPIIGKRKRYLTPRECARLQGFPDSFICSSNDSVAYRQFGNSVNVDVVKLMASYMFGDSAIRALYSS